MLRKLVVIATLICALLAVSAPEALAADSTCATHQLAVTQWSIQSDDAYTSWDFQCGGANNEAWTVFLYLQWKDSGGAWHTFDCDNGLPCYVERPTTGSYAGGSEHSGTNHWNVAGQLNCLDIRSHAVVVFVGNSPRIGYNSITYNIGC